MKTFISPPRDSWEKLSTRPAIPSGEIEGTVRDIIRRVKSEGDRALVYFNQKFGNSATGKLKIDPELISGSSDLIPDKLKEAISIAKSNIEKFHASQLVSEEIVETVQGVKCWRKSTPIEKVGLYIPGGTAPLFSTILMLAIPAKIAGCKRIIVCTPRGQDGTVNPSIIYAASVCGITEIYGVGGAQAIAAMAYRTETIPRVYKILARNQYVTKAKELVQLDGVSIDIPAGPSEVLVIADGNSDPEFVAADLLSQAEHGADSRVVMLTEATR